MVVLGYDLTILDELVLFKVGCVHGGWLPVSTKAVLLCCKGP